MVSEARKKKPKGRGPLGDSETTGSGALARVFSVTHVADNGVNPQGEAQFDEFEEVQAGAETGRWRRW